MSTVSSEEKDIEREQALNKDFNYFNSFLKLELINNPSVKLNLMIESY